MKRPRAIGRWIAGIAAVVLLGVAWHHYTLARDWGAELRRADSQVLARFPNAFAAPGTYTASVHHHHAVVHAHALRIAHPDGTGISEVLGEVESTPPQLRIVNASTPDAEPDVYNVNYWWQDYTMDGDAAPISRFDGLTRGEHHVTLTVSEPMAALVDTPHVVELRNDLCGCEGFAGLYHFAIVGASLVGALVLTVGILHVTLLQRERAAAAPAAA